MIGVEILSQSEVVVATANSAAGIITFGIILILMAVIGTVAAWNQNDFGYLALFAILGLLLGILGGVIVEKMVIYPTAYETHYKVTIDDSVSMNEFLDKYEILDQEGKIYTVKERE